MAEDVCISKSCGKAYEHTAANFPFTISYEKSRNSGSATFDFKVRLNFTCMGKSDTLAHPKRMQETGVCHVTSPFRADTCFMGSHPLTHSVENAQKV